jgi:hypothetical protein
VLWIASVNWYARRRIRRDERPAREPRLPHPADPDLIMKVPARNPPLGSEYDNFLFEPIGDDRNGMPLSVVSLLGRMDFDPWEEAAALAGLSADEAARKLAALLRALPDQTMLQSDPDGAAARLIALLPRPTNNNKTTPSLLSRPHWRNS